MNATDKEAIVHNGVEIFVSKDIRVEKQDDRKRKRYAGQVALHVEIEKLAERARDVAFKHLDKALDEVCATIKTACESREGVNDDYEVKQHASSYWSRRNASQHKIDVYVYVARVVDRPKATPTNVEAVLGDKGGRATGLIVLAIKAALDATKAELDQETRRLEAERVARLAAAEAHKKAKEITRFEQRLAALEAELKAEREVQLAKIAEEIKAEGVEDEDGKKYDARVVEVALRHAAEVFPSIHRSFLPGLEERGFIKKEEV